MLFFFSSRRRHTRLQGDWSSDVCSSDLCQHAPTPDCCSSDSQCVDDKRCTADLCDPETHACKNPQITNCSDTDAECADRSEERRVGKECRYRGWPDR